MVKQPVNAELTCEMAQRAIALLAMSSPEDGFDLSPSAPGTLAERHTVNVAVPRVPPGNDEVADFADRSPSDVFALMLDPHLAAAARLIDKDSDKDFEEDGEERHDNEGAEAKEYEAFRALFPGDTLEPNASTIYRQNTAVKHNPGSPPREALEMHLRTCRACQAEMAATTAFFRALAQDAGEPGPEPSPTLLARSRMRLDASLDSYERAPFWKRIGQQMAFSAGRLRAAPVLSSGLLMLGLLAGAYGGYHAGQTAHDDEQNALLLAPPAPETPSVVADVTGVIRDPESGMVSVHYDRLVPDVLTATADDPSIRELLMIGTENGTDPQVRDTSVGLLGGGCQDGAPCGGASVRNALLNALTNDKTPEVRREALAGLQPFISEDTQVRDAVLSALMNDPSSAVRIEAVRMLGPVDVDSSVRQALHTVANSDGDPSIRSASLQALKEVPQVQ
jgi:anti-sigma factor RsiW